KYPFPKLLEELESAAVGKLTANNEDVRLADVVIAWNVFQHFYPYFDVVNVDWDSELTNALRKAMTDKNERDFYYTLSRLIAKLQDGHGGVKHEIENKWAGLPFRVDWIENQVVVTACKEPTKVKIGDIILSVDGTKAEQTLLDAEQYISGSPQWRRYVALRRFGYGDRGTKANLVIKRGNQTFEVEVERNYIAHTRHAVSESKRPKIDAIKDDIYYVDLTRAQWKEIKERIHDLAEAKGGVIFDLRGYPSVGQDVIRHLLREKDTSEAWIRVPRIIYPDLANIVGYREGGWELKPKKPRIKGKVVFLTDARAISAAESYMSFVEHYKLGEIVGQPTAGTNGNVNPFRLLGGFTVRWTGTKVLKHDGSQHHLIGILPTVPVKRTIKGVIEGRDEFLEKALEIINKQ
ncbi:MAG: S41 family peptidase, partial [Planctomycetota bacterium]